MTLEILALRNRLILVRRYIAQHMTGRLRTTGVSMGILILALSTCKKRNSKDSDTSNHSALSGGVQCLLAPCQSPLALYTLTES